MDQDRLRVLALPVLLQILQQVVLEISNRMMTMTEANGGNAFPAFVPSGYQGGCGSGSNFSGGGGMSGCEGGGGVGSKSGGGVGLSGREGGGGCGGGGVATMSGGNESHDIHTSAESPFDLKEDLLMPRECTYRCQYCRNRCNKGYKVGHRYHSCHEHRHCRH